jgi:hypothetical protein
MNLQPPKIGIKTFTFEEQEYKLSTSKNKNKNLDSPKIKTRIFKF